MYALTESGGRAGVHRGAGADGGTSWSNRDRSPEFTFGHSSPSSLLPGVAVAGDLSDAGRIIVGPADWIATDGQHGAFGSGRQLFRTQGIESPQVVSQQELSVTVRDAVLVGHDLYVNDGKSVRQVNLDHGRMNGTEVLLDPTPIGDLRTARMTDYIVVAENGFGLRIIELPTSAEMLAKMNGKHHGPTEPTQIATIPLAMTFRALATFGNTVYAGSSDSTVVAIDIENPGEPRILTFPVRQDVAAIAVNGPRLYVLGEAGLRSWNISNASSPQELNFMPGIEGRAVRLLGRTLQIASGGPGLQMIYDASSIAGGTIVTVGASFFSPKDINVENGDQVTWEKTGGFHNVESCPAAGGVGGCAGLSATQAFISGPATGSPFTFNTTFTVDGTHDYICIVHAGIGMIGSVTVSTSRPAPPAVPDGQTGQPMTVGRTDAMSDLLRISFDPSTCSSTDHQIIYGGSSGLPTSFGGAFTTLGSTCAIGAGAQLRMGLSGDVPRSRRMDLVVDSRRRRCRVGRSVGFRYVRC